MPEIIDIIETNEKAPTLLPWQWLVILCIGIVLLLAIYYYLKRPKHTRTEINSLEQALAKLKEINDTSDDEQKDSNWLTVELSLLTRSYLQGQFKNKSIFQTHEEYLEDHSDLEQLPAPAREKLSVYLSSLAEHKYAPAPDLPEEKNKLIQLTESLLRGIESTIPKSL